MGLLDFMGTSMDDPKTAATLALAQGLLTGRSGMTGLLGGLQGYGATMQAAQDRQRQIEREKLQQQMLQAQAQQLQQAAAERKAAAERAAGVEAAYRGAFRSPEQQAMAQNGGPTVAAAGAVGNFRPTIDQNALIAGLAKADPQAAAQMLAPEKPNYMTVDGALVQTNAQGGPKAVFERQKPTDWNQLIVTGPDGQPMVNRMLLDAKGQIARAGASNVSVNTGQKGLDNTLKLRGDFRGEPVYKAHQEMESAYSQINQALKQANPVGDLAAATKIMKLLDPGSVVRESELGMAMAATGLLDRVQNYAGHIINGTKLTPKQRQEFETLANALYSESVKQYGAKRSEYEGIASRNGLNVADVLGPSPNLPSKPGANASADPLGLR